jgi:hypothetical protein
MFQGLDKIPARTYCPVKKVKGPSANALGPLCIGALFPNLCPIGQTRLAATYSPASHCSTIGATGLNFSVRNGKRCSPVPWPPLALRGLSRQCLDNYREGGAATAFFVVCSYLFCSSLFLWRKAFGSLVPLGCAHCCACTCGLSTS